MNRRRGPPFGTWSRAVLEHCLRSVGALVVGGLEEQQALVLSIRSSDSLNSHTADSPATGTARPSAWRISTSGPGCEPWVLGPLSAAGGVRAETRHRVRRSRRAGPRNRRPWPTSWEIGRTGSNRRIQCAALKHRPRALNCNERFLADRSIEEIRSMHSRQAPRVEDGTTVPPNLSHRVTTQLLRAGPASQGSTRGAACRPNPEGWPGARNQGARVPWTWPRGESGRGRQAVEAVSRNKGRRAGQGRAGRFRFSLLQEPGLLRTGSRRRLSMDERDPPDTHLRGHEQAFRQDIRTPPPPPRLKLDPYSHSSRCGSGRRGTSCGRG